MGLYGVGFVRADYPGNRTGDHTSNIFFAACGSSIASDQLNSPVEVMDFAPTVLNLYNLQVPADMQGKIIHH